MIKSKSKSLPEHPLGQHMATK